MEILLRYLVSSVVWFQARYVNDIKLAPDMLFTTHCRVCRRAGIATGYVPVAITVCGWKAPANIR